MLGKLTGWEDTIVALATPQGTGAIGIIRVSGKRAFEIVDSIFPSKNLFDQSSHSLHVGYLIHNDTVIDEVVLSLFKAPRSYTAEDVIEISCHGSNFIQEQIITLLNLLGARNAKPGEFTQRAFINGKLDLAQAESVADLISSNTEVSRKTALQNMRGGFSKILKEIREELLQFSSLIELELDFSQEDVEFVDMAKLYSLLNKVDLKVKGLIESFQLGNVIKNGVQIAIIGKPNAGKSTLLNTFLNEDRAIVSAIAGTTRDTIEEVLNINGILFRLIDTAGIRENSIDEIEHIGVGKSLEKMRNADLVIYLFDVNETEESQLIEIKNQFQKEGIKAIFVGNKNDVAQDDAIEKRLSFLQEIVFISAKEKTNIDSLKDKLYRLAVSEKHINNEVMITNTRHIEALKKVQGSLKEVMAGIDEKLSIDLLVPDIKSCLHFIGEITGEVTNEDQLDYIFSKFCIGK
jgi:tRNA modification GTPase